MYADVFRLCLWEINSTSSTKPSTLQVNPTFDKLLTQLSLSGHGASTPLLIPKSANVAKHPVKNIKSVKD